MTTVESKVVSIQFDNVAFQKKMSETIASLDKLRASLDMAGAKQGLGDLGAATKNFSMEQVGVQVEGISAKFAALATIGITALATLTQKAIEAGINITKALTINPIQSGFSEFEQKMGSIQTIMAGSGESLEVVNQKLNELNAYSDKTIYSFADMTANIGKFTNAGVGLDDSVAAIQGVANVAALSGANAEEASRGMYNFAQALSTGSVKLIDWKSIELANMGTVEFKQQLIDSAVAMGTLNKASDGTLTTLKGTTVTTQNFASTLNDAWLSSDVLTSTLGRFSDESTEIGKRAAAAAQDVKTFSQMVGTMKESLQSGWAMSFEHIFGNFEEGKRLWTSIMSGFNAVVGTSVAARNKVLADWKEMGGRNELFGGLAHGLIALQAILKPIKDAFREIFPKKTGAELFALTKQFSEFMQSLKIAPLTAYKIKNAFEGLFSILSIGWEILKGVGRVFFTLAGGVLKVLSPLLSLASGSGDLVHSLHDVLVEGKGIETFFDKLVGVLNGAFSAMAGLVGGFVEFVEELGIFSRLSGGLSAVVDVLESAASAIRDFFTSFSFGKDGSKETEEAGEQLEKTASLAERLLSALKNVFSQIGDMLAGIGRLFKDAFAGLGDAISNALGTGDFNQVLNVIKTGLLGGILAMLVKFFRNGIKLDFGQGGLMKKLGQMVDSIKSVFGTLESTLKSLQANIRADTLIKIATAVGILAVAIIALSLVDGAALTKAMAAITVGFTEMTAIMIILEKQNMGATGGKIFAMAAGMVLLAAAMAILVIPIKVLSTMSLTELAKGLGGVAIGIGIMAKGVSAIAAQTGTQSLVKAGISMIFISIALIVLAKAIKKFSDLGIVDMALGLTMAAGGIYLLIKALEYMPDDIQKDGLGLLILAFALGALARVVRTFAGMSIATIAKGFIAIAAGLALIGEAMWSFPDDMESKALSLIGISIAMVIMGKALEQVGKIPFGSLVKGVLGLTAMLIVLAAAIIVMEEAQGGVVGLLAAAAGLLIIGHAIEQVGKIPIDQLITGILGIAAVLVVLAVAAQVAPALLLLGVALMTIGIAVAFVGVGIALLGKGFELMAKFGGEAMEHIVAAMQELIRQMPQFISAFVEGLIQAAVEIGDAMPQLVETIVNVLSSVLDAVIEIAPKIGEAATVLISTLLLTFRNAIPHVVQAGIDVILGFLVGIRNNISGFVSVVAEIITSFLDTFGEEMPRLVSSVVDFLATAFQEVAFGMGELMPRLMIGVGRAFLEGFWTGLTDELGKLAEVVTGIIGDIIGWFTSGFGIASPSKVMMEMGKNVIQGLINGVKAMMGILKKVFVDIPVSVVKWLFNAHLWLVTKGRDAIKGFGDGVIAGVTAVANWFLDLKNKILYWVGDAGDILYDAGRAIIRGIWSGLLSMKDWIMDKAKQVWEWVSGPFEFIGGIFSPSRVFAGYGVNIAEGLIVGLDSMNRKVEIQSEKLGKTVQDGWNNAKVDLANTLGSIDEFNPTITPVLDLSKVQADSKKISGMIDSSRVVAADVSLRNASVISAATAVRADDVIEPTPTGPTEVKFEQNIYAPEALSTADIYRGTKSQIAMAKEELKIA